MSNRLVVTRFPDVLAEHAEADNFAWAELVRWLARQPRQPVKNACSLIKLATFGTERTPKGSLRHDRNVKLVTGLEGDYDAGEITPEEAIARAERHGVRACIVTSYSHLPERPRWRVFAPLAQPVAPAERSRLLARLNGALGGVLAPESFTLSQSYYIGGRPGGEYRVLRTFGDAEAGCCVDELDELDAIAIGKARSSLNGGAAEDAADNGERPTDGRIPRGQRHSVLFSQAGKLRRTGMDPPEILAALRVINERRCDPPFPDEEIQRIAGWTDGLEAAEELGEPAPADVPDGAAVLERVHRFLGRFVAYPSECDHVAHTLWVAHTHLMAAWESTPRLSFLSPEPGSGKTRALEVSELLVPNPVEAVNVTPAYLFRKVGDPGGLPTILFDEIDTVFGPKAKDNEEIRGLLNAGHRRGAVAGRCVVKGKKVETEEISAYCAVAVAGLGGLPDTLLSRSVVVRMRRRAPDERVEAFRRRVHAGAGHALRDQLAAWSAGVVTACADAWPEMPEGIQDRNADVWEPLLAVADAAGGEWPNRARVAAVALVALSMGSTPSLGIRLLSDLRDVFGDADAMSTEEILKALHVIEEAPWGELKGKPLNARGLAQRLREYGIKPKNVRIGAATPKGYAREDLFDAWQRYLPKREGDETGVGTPPYESATSATGATGWPEDEFEDLFAEAQAKGLG